MTIKACQCHSLSFVSDCIFLSLVPLLVNLLFGLLGLGFLMCLHAASAQELLSADGTRRKNKCEGESVKFDCNTGFFEPPSIYLAFWWKTLFPVKSHPHRTVIIVSGCQGGVEEQKATEDMRNFSHTDGGEKNNQLPFTNKKDQRRSQATCKPNFTETSVRSLSCFSLAFLFTHSEFDHTWARDQCWEPLPVPKESPVNCYSGIL